VRVVCHAQHLTGIGHFVRMHLIAARLAEAHEVHLVDGGRPVARPVGAAEPRRIRLPRLVRTAEAGVTAVDGGPAEEALARRAGMLAEAVGRIRPDAVLVDHYPFAKWELGPEISAMIDAARAANPQVRVLCSLRDIAPPTGRESLAGDAYADRVVDLLGERFDGILVHGDPAFTRFEDHWPAAGRVPVPVRYTGFVAEPPGPRPAPGRWAVLSGGGVDASRFFAAATEAFLRAAPPDLALHVFAGPGHDLPPVDPTSGRVQVHPFSSAFAGWLGHAALSISRAGYNTSTGLLAAGIPAVVVPDPRLSDQPARGRLLAAAGLVHLVEGDRQDDVDAVAAAISAALDGPRPRHTFDLDGVATTRRLVEEWPRPT
jgi:predicted glycosyltransferase